VRLLHVGSSEECVEDITKMAWDPEDSETTSEEIEQPDEDNASVGRDRLGGVSRWCERRRPPDDMARRRQRAHFSSG
jgi:hypothetical protein